MKDLTPVIDLMSKAIKELNNIQQYPLTTTVFVEVSAEETEMLFRALDALVDTSMESFTCEEYEMLGDLADRINKSFKDETP